MPLQLDDAYRGPHAVHVHPHKKLGKHRTVIEEALSLISDLIDDETVAHIELGKMTTASGKGYEPRVECVTKGKKLQLLLVCKTAAQGISVTVKEPEFAEEAEKHITIRWGSITGQNKLRVV